MAAHGNDLLILFTKINSQLFPPNCDQPRLQWCSHIDTGARLKRDGSRVPWNYRRISPVECMRSKTKRETLTAHGAVLIGISTAKWHKGYSRIS